MRRGARSGSRWRGFVVGASCVVVLCGPGDVLAESADGDGAPSLMRRLADSIDRSLVARCLTPDVGTAMSQVVASGALKPVLTSDLALTRGNVGGQEIEIQIEDSSHQAYTLTLALPGARADEPAGRGTRFWFYLAPSNPTNARARDALLALAGLFDAAIPETALVACGGRDQPREDPRYPRSLALGSAVVEALIIIVALIFGLRAIRSEN